GSSFGLHTLSHRWALSDYQTLVSSLVLYGGMPVQDAEKLTEPFAFFLMEKLKEKLKPKR
ncbi:hypothetical protein SEEM1594_05353, partial [Salmonella enterica subsp. enterica serovar Muenchen str. baa1594]